MPLGERLSTQRSWIFVIIGLLIGSFLGGAIQVVFSSERVEKIVQDILSKKEPKFIFHFDKANFRFSDGIWPALAIEMNSITVQAKDKCITQSSLEFKKAFIPLKIMDFIFGRIRLGNLRVENIDFHWAKSHCTVTNHQNPLKTDDISIVEQFLTRRWNKELINTTRLFSELNINSVHVLGENKESFFKLLNVNLIVDSVKRVSFLEFGFLPGTAWVSKQAFTPAKMQAEIRSEEIVLNGYGNLKEGQLEVQAQWRIQTGEADIRFEVKDLPLDNLVGIGQNWGILTSFQPKISNQWITCKAQMRADIRSLSRTPVKLANCFLYGDLGEMNVLTTDFNLKNIYPITLSMKDAEPSGWMKSMGQSTNWGMVSDYGRFSGEFELQGANQFEIRGHLRNALLYLSNRKDRARQPIGQVQFKLNLYQDKFLGRFNNFYLEDGLINGQFSFNVGIDGTGYCQLALDKVKWPTATQVALFGGTTDVMAIYGKGNIQKSKVVDFTGDFSLNKWSTEDWVANEIRSRFTYTNVDSDSEMDSDGQWLFNPRVANLTLNRSGAFNEMYESVFKSKDFKKKDLVQLEELSMSIHKKMGLISWSLLKSRHESTGIKLESEGRWQDEKILSGSLVVYDGKNKSRSWSIRGSLQDAKFIEN